MRFTIRKNEMRRREQEIMCDKLLDKIGRFLSDIVPVVGAILVGLITTFIVIGLPTMLIIFAIKGII